MISNYYTENSMSQFSYEPLIGISHVNSLLNKEFCSLLLTENIERKLLHYYSTYLTKIC